MKLLRFAAPLTAALADTRGQTALTVESRLEEARFSVRVAPDEFHDEPRPTAFPSAKQIVVT